MKDCAHRGLFPRTRSVLRGFQTRRCCGGANPRRLKSPAHALNKYLSPPPTPDRRQKDRDNSGPERGSEKEVHIAALKTLKLSPHQDSHPERPPGRPLEEGPESARVGHPHIRDPPLSPERPAIPGLEVHFRQRTAPPRALLGWAQPVRLGPDQDSTPRTSRSTSRRGRGRRTHSRGAWGTSSNSRCALSRALRVPGATSEPSRRAGTPRSGFHQTTPAPGRSLSLKKNS